MGRRFAISFIICWGIVTAAMAQQVILQGHVLDVKSRQPVEYATMLIKEKGLWAITDEKGKFIIREVPCGKQVIIVQCLGYAPVTLTLDIKDDKTLEILLQEDNLQLEEVEVVAQRKTDEATTSYSIDRQTLDNQQILNLADLQSLMPGGKSANPSLMSDTRIALRSNGNRERGNASFGTAIEIDGIRMNNNAIMDESLAASTRTVGISNIERVEIITGIPSVEYGDLSNGIVKVKMRKGKSPFIVESKINQHTQLVAINKGLELSRNNGILNCSFEHARSLNDIASPHTAYQRNAFSMNYMKAFMAATFPLKLNIGFRGNVGGYNSKADPDENLDDYTKTHDNAFSGSFALEWLLNKNWITNLNISGNISYGNKKTESYYHTSSASTQPYLHTTKEGYHIAEDYDTNPNAGIILGPTGYWYVKGFSDSKPLDYRLKLKGDWTHLFGSLTNRLMAGFDFTGSRNKGHGTYYEDLRYAPTWREYRYDALPTMKNVALYAENRLSMPIGGASTLELTIGLREDITFISGSDYEHVNSFSPRFASRFVFWKDRKKAFITNFSAHAGWGKSVKLPSFQILYPSPSYSDKLSFASTSTADNRSYYAYYTHLSKSIHNPDLRWQYTHQADAGIELRTKVARIALSAFYHKTFCPYMAISNYTPFTYLYTAPSALNACDILANNRLFTISPKTGVISVTDKTGEKAPMTLEGQLRNTYLGNVKYINASPISRYGIEWIIDFAQIKALHTQIRLDGNYYQYRGTDETHFTDVPLGLSTRMSDGRPYQYIGHYIGANATSTNYTANASVTNGTLTRQANMNTTVTTHIPKIRMIVSLRLEISLYQYSRALCQLHSGTRGYVVETANDYFGTPYNGKTNNQTVIVYPEYYSTWEEPNTLIPFAETFRKAKNDNPQLYKDLAQLVVRSNYSYTMNPNRLSAYYNTNISVTKEISNYVSLSFYANNFFNNMKTVHSSQTDLETTLFESRYIPSFYYGLSLRLKI